MSRKEPKFEYDPNKSEKNIALDRVNFEIAKRVWDDEDAMKGSGITMAKTKQKKTEQITAEEFDRKFESGDDMSEHLDWSQSEKFVQVSFPLWMLKEIDKEANKLGIARQAMIKVWLNEKLEKIKDREADQAERKAV